MRRYRRTPPTASCIPHAPKTPRTAHRRFSTSQNFAPRLRRYRVSMNIGIPHIRVPSEKVEMERVERTRWRVLSATQTSEAGVTRLACLVRSTRAALCGRRPARIRAFSRPHTQACRRAEKVELQGGRCAGHGDPLRPRSCAKSFLIEVKCAGSGRSCEVEDDLRPVCPLPSAESVAGRSGPGDSENFCTSRSIFDIALGLAPFQFICTEVCKLVCLYAHWCLHSSHIQTSTPFPFVRR